MPFELYVLRYLRAFGLWILTDKVKKRSQHEDNEKTSCHKCRSCSSTNNQVKGSAFVRDVCDSGFDDEVLQLTNSWLQ